MNHLWLSITTCEKCKEIIAKRILQDKGVWNGWWKQKLTWEGFVENGQHRCPKCNEVVKKRNRHVPIGCLAVGEDEIL